MWDTGKETSRLEMADEAEHKYDAPQLTIHRADRLDALRWQLPDAVVKLGHRIASIDFNVAIPRIRFTMAQGACMAIEDAVVLGKWMVAVARSEVPLALKRYEEARRERTARVQIGSRGDEWLREGGNSDWVYGYDGGAVKWEQTNAQQ
jgi:hypothetical protein